MSINREVRQSRATNWRRSPIWLYLGILCAIGLVVRNDMQQRVADKAREQARADARQFAESVPFGCQTGSVQSDKIPDYEPSSGMEVINVAAGPMANEWGIPFPADSKQQSEINQLGYKDRVWFHWDPNPEGHPDTVMGAYLRLEGVARRSATSPSGKRTAYAVELAGGGWEVRTNFRHNPYKCDSEVVALAQSDEVTCFVTVRGGLTLAYNNSGGLVVLNGLSDVACLAINNRDPNLVYLADRNDNNVFRIHVARFLRTGLPDGRFVTPHDDILELECTKNGTLAVRGGNGWYSEVKPNQFKPL